MPTVRLSGLRQFTPTDCGSQLRQLVCVLYDLGLGAAITHVAETDLRDFHLRWASLRPPQRPTAHIESMMRGLLAERPGPALQLGVTPEIARASDQGIAIDWNPSMITLAWPGDSLTHHAKVGNWLDMEFAPGSFATAFGDGSLTMLSWPQDYRLLMRNLQRTLNPGGRLVVRCFIRPEACESVEELADAAWSGGLDHFGEFKLRLNMATAAVGGRVFVPVADIHSQFEAHFADRERLAKITGWGPADFSHIDAYKGASSSLSYATRAEIVATLPEGAAHQFFETAGYPLAQRCPLLVVDFPS